MAFDLDALSEIRTLNFGRRYHAYDTTDDLSTVLTAGYFDAGWYRLAARDRLDIEASDGRIMAVVSAASAAGVTITASTDVIPAGRLGTGSVARSVEDVLAELPASAQTFDAVGDGVADDTVALAALFNSIASGGAAFLPPGEYKITSQLTHGFTNARIFAIPGTVTITGAIRTGSNPNYQYPLLKLLDSTNLSIYGVNFENTYDDDLANEDAGKALLYCDGAVLRDVFIEKCKFTAPNCGANGLAWYLRTTSGDTDGSLDNCHITDCEFYDLGRIACVVMNRGTGSDKYEACRNFYFERNIGRRLGLSETYGFLLSLDGYGEKFSADDNTILDAYGIGIENTLFNNGSISGNVFGDFVAGRAYSPMSFSVHSGSDSMRRLRVRNNRTLEGQKATGRTNFINVSDSEFSDNYISATGDYAVHFRDGSNNKIRNDKYISDHTGVMLVGSSSTTTADNVWTDCLFDGSANADAGAAIRFDGTATTGHRLVRGNIKKGGGVNGTDADRVNSAPGNAYRCDAVLLDGVSVQGYQLISLTGSSTTWEDWRAQSGLFRVTSAGAGVFTLTLPIQSRDYGFVNDSNNTLQCVINGNAVNINAGGGRLLFAYSEGINSVTVLGGLSLWEPVPLSVTAGAGSATNLFTAATLGRMYEVDIVDVASNANRAKSIVYAGASPAAVSIAAAGNLTITVSGTTIQVSNSGGSAITIAGLYRRLT